MAKFQSPLLGYNNNVRHRGRVFHIQTEDSGVNHPHVITHLFMDGGRILKSVKKSYAEHVGNEGLQETVRVLMKEQHKAMFIALRDGQFDELALGPKKGTDPTLKAVVAPPPPSTLDATAPATNPEPPQHVDVEVDVVVTAPAAHPADDAPNTISERAPEPFALDANGPQTIPETMTANVAANANGPIHRPSAAELTLDFDALERDSGITASPMFQANDLPPPPKNLFAKERGTGAYSALEVEPHHDDTRKAGRGSGVPARNPTKPPPSGRSGGAGAGAENGRYAAARPASIFGTTLKPAANGSSIFGDELVSDKSLDEVILSYLAEDLDPRK